MEKTFKSTVLTRIKSYIQGHKIHNTTSKSI